MTLQGNLVCLAPTCQNWAPAPESCWGSSRLQQNASQKTQHPPSWVRSQQWGHSRMGKGGWCCVPMVPGRRDAGIPTNWPGQ